MFIINKFEISLKKFDFTSENVKDFNNKRRPDLVIPCMRTNKLLQLEECLRIKGVFLIKGPPGSGKTTMADLFQFYLGLKYETSICIRINVKNVHTMKKLDDEFLLQVNKTLKKLVYSPELKNVYVIIDEAHEIYGEEFENFWNLMKEVADGTRKTYIKFLLCTDYSYNRIQDKFMIRTIFVLQNRCESFNFLKFSNEEYNEIISYYCKSTMNNIFPITEEIKNLIWEETVGFPQLTINTILFLKNFCNNSEYKNARKVHEVMFSKQFQKDVLCVLKAFPRDFFTEFSSEELKFLRNIHWNGSIEVSYFRCEKSYEVAKKMESSGIVYEDSVDKFKFPSPFLSSSYFYYMCDGLKKENITNEVLLAKNRVDLAIMTIEKMIESDLIKKLEKNYTPSEDWLFEFFMALRNMVGTHHMIHSQCSKYTENCFIGELDLYVNGLLCQPYKLIREGDNVENHLIWKYMPLFPDFLTGYKEKVAAHFLLPKNDNFMVIDFRKDNEFDRIDKLVVTNAEGKELDIGALLKKDIMRVCFGYCSKIDIFYEEVLIKTIDLLALG